MARRARKTAPAAAPLWTLLSDEISGVPNHCLWQHRDSGATVVLADGIDPNTQPLPAGLTLVDTAAPDDAPEAEETAADRIAEILQRGKEGAEARVRVAEITPEGQRAFCADYSPEEFEAGGTVNLIRRKWGPGRYSIELYARNPKTKGFSRYGSDVVLIKAQREPDASELATSALMGLREDIKQALSARPADGSEMSRMKDTLGLMVLMREAMGVDKLAGGRNPNPLELVTQLVGALRGAKDLAKEINQPAEPEGLLERLAPKAIDMIQASMARQPLAAVQLPFAAPPANGASPVSTPPSASSSTPAAAGAASPNGEGSMDQQLQQGLRVAVQTLNGMALFDMDPDDAAEMIFNSDQIPAEVLPILKAGDWFEQLARIAPACQPHKDWYVKTHAALLKLFAEEEGQNTGAPDGAAAP